MNGDTVAVQILALIYFVVLVVVALERSQPGRQCRHRQGPIDEAR